MFSSIDQPPILIVDDDAAVRNSLSEILTHSGFEAQAAENGEEAVRLAGKQEFGSALVDLEMPGLSGIDTVKQLKKQSPDMEIIIITGHPTFETSQLAIREHVFDYICKPAMPDEIKLALQRALERRHLILKNRELVKELISERKSLRRKVKTATHTLSEFESQVLHGDSKPMERVRQGLAEVALSDMTILLRGESGTGKDLAARLVHQLSEFRDGPFVKINCPAIPDALLESELFGHEAGAFTSAEQQKPGRFELATDGTIFLDEIGEIPIHLQAKLLQVIESKTFNRVGGNETLEVNCRIISATNAILEELIDDGKFRADLFYRLNEFSVTLPSLRERRKDIPILVEHFLAEFATQYGRDKPDLPPALMRKIVETDWPGNVRELKAAVKRYFFSSQPEAFDNNSGAQNGHQPKVKGNGGDLAEKVQEAEAKIILEELTKSKWNRKRAAKNLGIGYSSLRRKIIRHNLA